MRAQQRCRYYTFEFDISSLQVTSSFTCSVASLSLLPDHYLPGHHTLHCKVLADLHFDWGGLSTCAVALTEKQKLFTTIPRRHRSRTPSERERVGQRYPNPNITGMLWHRCCEALLLKPSQSHVWVGVGFMPWNSPISDRSLWPMLLALLIPNPYTCSRPGGALPW
jgi:hypothetical protein